MLNISLTGLMNNEGNDDQSQEKNGGQSTSTYIEYVFRYGGQVAALAVLLVTFSIMSPYFLSVNNFLNILLQSSVGLLLAIGQTFVILSAGIDLSNVAVLALSATVSATLITEMGVAPSLGIIVALVVGIMAGIVNGLVITKGKIPDFIATLGMMSLAQGLALIVAGGLPITGIPPVISYMGSGELGPVPVAVIISLSITILAWFISRYTRIGRQIYAVGGNAEAARVSGISPTKTKIAVYIFSGITAAVAGLVLTGRLNSANGMMGAHWQLTAIAAVIIGGTNLFGGEGSIGGTLVGMLILGTLTNGLGLLAVSDFIQQVVRGSVIIVVVIYDQWRRRRAL